MRITGAKDGHALRFREAYRPCESGVEPIETIERDSTKKDRRGWEAAIYRMIGRGGLWTPEEINLMADYLGSDFGPSSKPASAPSK